MPFKVKKLREIRNMTQIELCKKAKVSRQTLVDLESGKDVNTTVATLQKLEREILIEVLSRVLKT